MVCANKITVCEIASIFLKDEESDRAVEAKEFRPRDLTQLENLETSVVHYMPNRCLIIGTGSGSLIYYSVENMSILTKIDGSVGIFEILMTQLHIVTINRNKYDDFHERIRLL